ncbi:polymer-forming cytoskeletal protein [Neobacillus muris]|uniref:polymer-forming cytoskeletal protein n=1 Tax=Neobacillus muris TaxID=2941334 RepID=UPI0020401367|nr:polymer-forming cytoskeletal protein [Neobacillus muris]
MEWKNKGDLLINGLGSSNGGQFNLVTLNGRGTINTDVECNVLDCNGSGVLKGNVKTTKARVNGNARFKGSIEAKKMTIDGNAKIEGNLMVDQLRVSGNAFVGGKVKGEELKVKGILKVGEDCEVEVFSGKYRFTIGGLLNADQVDVEIYGDCRAKEIGGRTITVKPHKGSLIGALFKSLYKTQLEAELIEGDKIDLENTTAKVVRGNQVRIGANCHIDIVEYTEEFSQDKQAVVNDVRPC